MAQIVIAGGTSGIGKACALHLVREGHKVLAFGRSPEHINDVIREAHGAPGRLVAHALDLTDPDAASRLRDLCGDRPLSGLINSVGRISQGGIEAETFEGWDLTMRGNLNAAFITTQALLPQLKAGAGSIVNVSSVCGQQPCESLSYSVSKAGLDMFTRHLARDLAPDGIRVNAVSAGVVPTNLHVSSGVFSQGEYDSWLAGTADLHPLGVGSVDAVSAAILFLLSNAASWVTGANLVVDGGRSVA